MSDTIRDFLTSGRTKQEHQRKHQQQQQEEQAADKAAEKPAPVANKAAQQLDRKAAAAAPSGSGNQSHSSHDGAGPTVIRDDAASKPHAKVWGLVTQSNMLSSRTCP